MEIEFKKKFVKQIEKLNNASTKEKLIQIIEKVKNATTLAEIENIKKLKGHDTAYRIRLGDYRIGFLYEDEKIVFAAFYPRKDIYNYFP